jgi:hypothetical protein
LPMMVVIQTIAPTPAIPCTLLWSPTFSEALVQKLASQTTQETGPDPDMSPHCFFQLRDMKHRMHH